MPALRTIRRAKAAHSARVAQEIAFSELMHAQAALMDECWDDDRGPEYGAACPYCNGDGGNKWDDYITDCPQCLGEGRVY